MFYRYKQYKIQKISQKGIARHPLLKKKIMQPKEAQTNAVLHRPLVEARYY
jgi:hypothetical protein